MLISSKQEFKVSCQASHSDKWGEMRLRAIELSFALFSTSGIRKVSMDHIARELRISKKTLYLLFPNKEKLLEAAFTSSNDRLLEDMRRQSMSKENVIVKVMNIYNLIVSFINGCNISYHRDLQQYAFIEEKNIEKNETLSQGFIPLINEGIKGGYFRQELNAEVASRILAMQSDIIRPVSELTNCGIKDVTDTFFIIFLRGICTDRGLEILNTII